MRTAARALGLALLLVPTMLAALFIAATARIAPRFHRRCQPWLMRRWFRLLARLFGLAVETEGKPAGAPAMLACNHLSWLDIVALGATVDGAFVSKAEIGRWPLIGFFARHGGRTLFIRRGEMRSLGVVGGILTARLGEGERVIFFPEGTVSGEQRLLRFKPRLFAAALHAGTPVQPVALGYTAGEGAPVAPMLDGDLFAFHALRILACRRTVIRLRFLEPVPVDSGDAREIAARVQSAVDAALPQDRRARNAPLR